MVSKLLPLQPGTAALIESSLQAASHSSTRAPEETALSSQKRKFSITMPSARCAALIPSISTSFLTDFLSGTGEAPALILILSDMPSSTLDRCQLRVDGSTYRAVKFNESATARSPKTAS